MEESSFMILLWFQHQMNGGRGNELKGGGHHYSQSVKKILTVDIKERAGKGNSPGLTWPAD